MSKTEIVRARVEPELKREAEAILKEIGLTPSEAITLFLTQVKLHGGMPFPLLVPNRKTRRAIREAQTDTNVAVFDTVADWAKQARAP